ncbi:MAG: response regulator [Hyphomicrobiaceae bacterium]|nr:response regulator [Hyphomicrobiaceae bacterium]
MRSEVGSFWGVASPLYRSLRQVRLFLEQNQLRLQRMAHLKLSPQGGVDSALGVVAAFAQKFATPLLVAGGGFAAAVVLIASGSAEPVLLAVLSLLAVGGAFLLFGLWTGALHLGERVRPGDVSRAAADGLGDGVQIAGVDGAVLYSNPALRNMLMRRAGGVASLEETFAQEADAARAYFRLNRAAERGEAREEEFYLRAGLASAAGGRWLRVSVRPIATEPATDVGAAPLAQRTLWHVVDITRERSREIETVASLEATIGFYDGLPQGLFAARPDGRLAHLNATLVQWLGLKAEPGKSFVLSDILPADGVSLVRAVSRAAPGKATRIDLDLLREDGSTFPAELICRGNGPRGMISVLVLDRSTEPQRRGQKAFSDEARLARQAETAPFGIATVASDGQIITSNPAFMRMFAVEGRPLPQRMSDLGFGEEDTAGVLEKALARASSGRPGPEPIEITFGGKREHTRRLYVHPLGSGAQGSAKGPQGAILYALDVSEQKALELKFAQSHKMEAVGQLAGGVAHDFNNVLTAIIGFSDLLLQTHRPTDRAYGDIMNIKSSANRAAGLVSQLLAFSRRQTLHPQVIELGEALTDLAPLITRSLGESIVLKFEPGRDLWYVKADKSQLTQVVINLAVNARDAMPGGGSLSIRTKNITERESLKLSSLGVAAAEYVLIEVEDTGVGIPADIIGKIFEPFFTTKEVGKGTGLGLSTVYGIVKQTGGYIFADSTVGRGTTFRVYLPRHMVTEAELASLREGPKKEAARDLTGTGRVLLVEDEDAVRNFAARALSRQGYDVLEAASGLEALEVMEREQGRIDLVVSDVIMPEMDGPTMLKEMRKTRPDLKIIFVSGYSDDAFKKSLDENEVYSFLPKPFTLPQIAAKVKEQLGR